MNHCKACYPCTILVLLQYSQAFSEFEIMKLHMISWECNSDGQCTVHGSPSGKNVFSQECVVHVKSSHAFVRPDPVSIIQRLMASVTYDVVIHGSLHPKL